MNGFYWLALFAFACKLIEISGELAWQKIHEAILWDAIQRASKRHEEGTRYER